MSVRILWRSTVFLITLSLIYLAFPILIVPSSLPAIKAIFIENKYPDNFQIPAVNNNLDSDLEIYQITLPTDLSLKDKLQLIKDLHRQGMDIMLNR